VPKEVKHWSYSAWSTWNKCRYSYYSGYILGIRGPAHPAMQRGIEIHRFAEFYLKGKIKALPPMFKRFADQYSQLRRAKPIVEEFWNVDSRFRFTKEREKMWCTMKMDAALAPESLDGWAYMQDLKTGREYEDHRNQGELYSCITLAKYPEAKGVITEFWYLDQGYPVQMKYPRKLLLKKTNRWLEEGSKLLDRSQKYLPSPKAEICKWCIHRSDKMGACTAWKKVLPRG
jgi:hypothetical protein